MTPLSIYTPYTDVSKLRRACADCGLVEMCFPAKVSEADRLRMKSAIVRAGPFYRGEHVYRQGDKFFAIYAVREGGVKNVVTDSAGREHVVDFYFPDEVFGFEAIADDCYPNDCIALETTTLCALPYNAVQEFALQYPHVLSEFIRLMSREMSRPVEDGSAMGAKERLAAFLLSVAQRMDVSGGCADSVALKMTRQDIAFHLGMAPETLSRIFAELESDQLIAAHGKKIRFLDKKALQTLTA